VSRAALESGADLVRWVLARVDTGLALTALGAELEAAPDPWYDGRAPLHRFTIVDTPHGGTVLTPPEVRVKSLPQARPGS